MRLHKNSYLLRENTEAHTTIIHHCRMKLKKSNCLLIEYLEAKQAQAIY